MKNIWVALVAFLIFPAGVFAALEQEDDGLVVSRVIDHFGKKEWGLLPKKKLVILDALDQLKALEFRIESPMDVLVLGAFHEKAIDVLDYCTGHPYFMLMGKKRAKRYKEFGHRFFSFSLTDLPETPTYDQVFMMCKMKALTPGIHMNKIFEILKMEGVAYVMDCLPMGFDVLYVSTTCPYKPFDGWDRISPDRWLWYTRGKGHIAHNYCRDRAQSLVRTNCVRLHRETLEPFIKDMRYLEAFFKTDLVPAPVGD